MKRGDLFGEETEEACLRGLREGIHSKCDGAVLSGLPEEAPAGEFSGDAEMHGLRQGIPRRPSLAVLQGMPRAEAA